MAPIFSRGGMIFPPSVLTTLHFIFFFLFSTLGGGGDTFSQAEIALLGEMETFLPCILVNGGDKNQKSCREGLMDWVAWNIPRELAHSHGAHVGRMCWLRDLYVRCKAPTNLRRT